jgi:hypothetical protein
MDSNSRKLLRAAGIAAAAPVLALAVSVAMAQSYSIRGNTVSGGGGASTGGAFSVSGTTAGQPDAGSASGGSFASTGGLWVIVSVLQTPDAPPLAFRRDAGGLAVFWPLPDEGWLLATTNDLTNWTNIPPANYGDDGVNRFVRIGMTDSIRFFRLYHPPPVPPP